MCCISYKRNFSEKGEICVSNSNLMVLRIFHVCVCVLKLLIQVQKQKNAHVFFPVGMVVNLAAQNRESHDSQNRGQAIARNSAARSNKMSRIAIKQNRGKSIQDRHPNRVLSMLKAFLESHDSNRTISESLDSRFRIADSVPLR